MNTLTARAKVQRGFTLVEMIIVMAIMAILAGVSASSFVWLNQSTQIRGAAFDLVADLDFARSEAVKRNDDVVVAPVGGLWANGWTVSAAGTVLRTRAALTGQVDFAAAPGTLTFDGSGRASLVTVGNFQICPPTGGNLSGRIVRIDASGLSRSTKAFCAA
ncbi:MAG: GspH/FimT family pseudopilin [Burkholderiaceae bacterium]|jgi:type IV fimbrial biogenesis protein FimT|nr:GspH/FimT family pseudopilin [Burkholderiaceae bacterium]